MSHSRSVCWKRALSEADIIPCEGEERYKGETQMPPDCGGEGDDPRRGGKDCEAQSQQLQEADEEGETAGSSSAHRDHPKVEQEKEGHCLGLNLCVAGLS